jgi:peptidoglycan/xylan/chitin deacetylase (PgdA/CDA1 family)
MQLQKTLRLGTVRTISERRAVLAVVAVTAVLALVGAAQDGLGDGVAEAAGGGDGGVGGEVGRAAGRGGAPGVCRGWVGLTFDDGPLAGPGGTRELLAVLSEYQVPATFFFVGQEMFLHPELVTEVLAAPEGHQIGSQGWSHPDMVRGGDGGAGLTRRQVNQELSRTDRVYESIVGDGARMELWRPPYGSVDEAVREAGVGQGDALTLWTVDAKDYGVGRGPGWRSAVAGIAARAGEASDGGIVLLHAGHPATVEALPEIIEGYWGAGMCFGVLAEGRVERSPAESPGLRYRVSAVDPKKVGNANLAVSEASAEGG